MIAPTIAVVVVAAVAVARTIVIVPTMIVAVVVIARVSSHVFVCGIVAGRAIPVRLTAIGCAVCRALDPAPVRSDRRRVCAPCRQFAIVHATWSACEAGFASLPHRPSPPPRAVQFRFELAGVPSPHRMAQRHCLPSSQSLAFADWQNRVQA